MSTTVAARISLHVMDSAKGELVTACARSTTELACSSKVLLPLCYTNDMSLHSDLHFGPSPCWTMKLLKAFNGARVGFND